MSISISPSGAGYVTKSPDKINYTWNENIRLTASAYSGYRFSNWGGELSGSQNPQNLTMNSDKNVTAYFVTQNNPVIAYNPNTLNQTCSQGTNATNQYLEVWNSGGGTLSYSISNNVSWLSCSPSSGTSTTGYNLITVYYSTSNLTVGDYFATITITSSNASNSSQLIQVNLKVVLNPDSPPNKICLCLC